MSSAPDLSIVLPCKNDWPNLRWLIPEMIEKLSRHAFTFEILIVDDSSKAQDYMSPYVRIIRRTGPPSLARALHDGLLSALGRWVITMDSDGNHRPEDLEKLILAMPQNLHAWIIAERSDYLDPKYTWIHRLVSWLGNTIIQAVCNLPTRDNTFGLLLAWKNDLLQLPLEKIFHGHGEYYFRLLSFAHEKKIPMTTITALHGIRPIGSPDAQPFKRLFSYSIALWNHYYLLRDTLYA